MGTPFFVLATGQSNMEATPAYSWAPSSRARVWNNSVGDDSSVGSAYTSMSSSTVNVAWRYASKIAEADAAKDVYVARYTRGARDISHWFGGCRYTYPGLGAGQMALSSTPEVTTQIFVSVVDILGIRRPYTYADLRVGEFLWVKQGASSYKYQIASVAASDTNGVTINVAYISGSGGISPGTVQVEFQPRFLYEIENSVPAALAAAGASTVDLVMWWQGESDAENNTQYNSEFEFVISYLQQKPWWRADTKILICGMNSTANNGMPTSDVQNARFASLAAASSNRYFMNTAASLSPTAWADVYHMTPIGYAAAGDLAMSVYSPPVIGGGGGGSVTITSMSAGTASLFLDISGRPEHQLLDSGRTGYGLWMDGPLRPYKDQAGITYIPIPHSENYRFKVTDWSSSSSWVLQGPTMLSARAAQESYYNNRQWVYGFWSTGATVYALTHHEWYRTMYTSAGIPGFNALNYTGVSTDFNREWVNGISHATSTDGGASFAITSASNNSSRLVLVPEPWNVQSARHMFGFFHASNIVKEGSYYYAAVEQRSVINNSGNAVGGVSLIRTVNPATPLGWEFWNGSSWIGVDHSTYQGNLSMQIPYRFFEKVNNYYTTNSNSSIGQNLRYHVPSSTWLMIGYADVPQSIGYSTSSTLANPQFNTITGITNPDPSIFYPYTAVFDEASTDLNFQNITGNTATMLIVDNTVSRARKATLTINVSSTSTPTYSLTPSTTSVNEGSTVTFNVATTGITDGTVLYWNNTGTTSGPDFTDGLMSGSVTVYGNSGSISRTLVNDALTEGPETIIMQLLTGSTVGPVVATALTVTVNDTSVPSTPTYAVTPSTTSVNEGSTVTFNVATTNVANGTLYWTNAGTTSGPDFSDGLMSGSFALNTNAGSISRILVNDALTEGPETIIMQIRTGSITGTIVATASTVTVNDTSTGAVATYAVTPSTASVNEGSTVTFNVATTNVANGTLYWTNAGTTSGADFTDGLNAGSLVINNNSGAITRTLANDGLTEGPETIVVQIRTGSTAGPIVATASTVTVNDTSTPGASTAKLCFRAPQGTWLNGALTTALKFRTSASAWVDKSATLAGVMVRNAANSGWITFSGATYSVAPSAGTVNAGSSVTYTITTTNFGSGTLYWDLAGSALSSDFTDGAITGTVAITNNGGTFTRSVSTTATDARTIILRLRRGSVTGPVVATASTVTISAIPTAPSALTMNRNNLDFYYYAQPVTPTASGYLDIRATVDTSAFFNYATGSIDHIVFAFDATGGQGSYNPHCGPIIRNGRNLWALARGVLLTRSGDVVVEEWNGTFSPFTAVIPNALGGGPLNVLSGVYTVRIRAGYVQSSVWTNTIYVSVHDGSSIYDTAIFQGSANGRNFNVTGSSSVAIAAISMGFVNPSDTGCVEKTGAGPAYGGVLPFTLDAYAY